MSVGEGGERVRRGSEGGRGVSVGEGAEEGGVRVGEGGRSVGEEGGEGGPSGRRGGGPCVCGREEEEEEGGGGGGSDFVYM